MVDIVFGDQLIHRLQVPLVDLFIEASDERLVLCNTHFLSLQPRICPVNLTSLAHLSENGVCEWWPNRTGYELHPPVELKACFSTDWGPADPTMSGRSVGRSPITHSPSPPLGLATSRPNLAPVCSEVPQADSLRSRCLPSNNIRNHDRTQVSSDVSWNHRRGRRPLLLGSVCASGGSGLDPSSGHSCVGRCAHPGPRLVHMEG